MKKFLIFLVSIVVVVCVGLTTYYFMRNNEIITIKTKEIYCNAGDTIPLKSLGISIKNANISKKTTFNYNAGGDAVTKFIEFDEQLNSFVVSQQNGGEVTLVISTSNKKYSDFTINVHIGNGSIQHPYYIFNESDLEKIGDIYRLDKSYLLMNDIALTSNFQPIGYNSVASSWSGFNGTFDGQNHTISGLYLHDEKTANAGLFSSINANATVKNLNVQDVYISGEYQTAGALAGTISGNVEKVSVLNATIKNNANNASTGAMAGILENNSVKMSFVDNAVINIGDNQNSASGAIVGGLFGKIKEADVQACYTNNVEINASSSTIVGGFVGEFTIGTDTGSIQQSYSNTTSEASKYGAFIGRITKAASFNKTNANMLRYLIGNIAVVYGKPNASSISDLDLVASYDATFFKNMTYANRSAFFEKDSAMYLIRGYAGAGDMIDTNEYIYYAVDAANLVNWDTTYVWDVEGNALPTLKMGSVYPTGPSSEYLLRNLEQKDLNDKTTFLNMFKSDINNESIKILEDMDFSSGWTPINLTNSTIDGNNKTIKVNLNNAVGENLGLFSTIENSTIKNLNIVVTGVSADAKNAGGLAGVIKSTSNLTTSRIENVKITFKGLSNQTITNFGGIAGEIQNTVIQNCQVYEFYTTRDSKITNAGGIVAVNGGTINRSFANSILYASEYAGGVAAKNFGTITNMSGSTSVICKTAGLKLYFGGLVGWNKSVLKDSEMSVVITIEDADEEAYVGGVVGHNEKEVSGVKVTGSKINIHDIDGEIKVGGVAGINFGKIEDVNNAIENVGTYNVDRTQYVGGVTAINCGSISRVLTQSNLSGNYVGGVVVRMNDSEATIDQVAVGKYNSSSKKFAANVLAGDKYVAGVVVDFRSGDITNIQCVNIIKGETNSTRSSLVALIFPYGATLRNATIDSSMTGYGTRYRETWTDFASYNNKAEFGFSNGETGDERFNLYKYDTFHGIMQSVVINGSKAGVSEAKAAMGAAFAWGKDYQDTEDSSFIKVVEGFNDVSQFQGSYTFVCAVSTLLGIKHNATKTLTFEIGRHWESNNGISLMFLKNM